MFKMITRLFNSSGNLMARKRPFLKQSQELPSDFDNIADQLLNSWEPTKDLKQPTAPKEKITFKGPDHGFKAPTKPNFKAEETTQDVQIKIRKVLNKTEENYELKLLESLKEKKGYKVDMDKYFDKRYNEKDVDFEWFEDKIYNHKPKNNPKWLKAKENILLRGKIQKESVQRTGDITVDEIIEILKDNAARNITVIDTKVKCDHLDNVIICEGRSALHIYSLADKVKRLAKGRYDVGINLPENLNVQGRDSDDWMVVDLGYTMIHCFTPEMREKMNIEGIWGESEDVN